METVGWQGLVLGHGIQLAVAKRRTNKTADIFWILNLRSEPYFLL